MKDVICLRVVCSLINHGTCMWIEDRLEGSLYKNTIYKYGKSKSDSE